MKSRPHPENVTLIEWADLARVVVRKTTTTGMMKGPAHVVATFDSLPDAREHLQWIKGNIARRKLEGARP